MTHICVSKLTIIGSDIGLSPDRSNAIIWTNAGLLLIGPLGTNFSEILIEILTFSFKKMLLKVSSANRRPFCLGLNVLKTTKRTFEGRHDPIRSESRIDDDAEALLWHRKPIMSISLNTFQNIKWSRREKNIFMLNVVVKLYTTINDLDLPMNDKVYAEFLIKRVG